MNGRSTFTSEEIKKLEALIVLRNKTSSSGQKSIRREMRNIGFYGKDDWGITDLQVSDLHSLIKLGRIKVTGGDNISFPTSTPIRTIRETKISESSSRVTNITKDTKSVLESFKLNRFDPKVDSENKVANSSGNYIICLRRNSKLPSVSITPIMTTFEGLNVIYTGIASLSLRTRDYRQHFKGNNAGRSTLRKSLGALFGYNQIARDINSDSNKTKFNNYDEEKLTEWMHSNLLMFFLPTVDYNAIELSLINLFNPPLNLKDNHNTINAGYRRLLSRLRTSKSI
jgi:hypothetical protein